MGLNRYRGTLINVAVAECQPNSQLFLLESAWQKQEHQEKYSIESKPNGKAHKDTCRTGAREDETVMQVRICHQGFESGTFVELVGY